MIVQTYLRRVPRPWRRTTEYVEDVDAEVGASLMNRSPRRMGLFDLIDNVLSDTRRALTLVALVVAICAAIVGAACVLDRIHIEIGPFGIGHKDAAMAVVRTVGFTVCWRLIRFLSRPRTFVRGRAVLRRGRERLR